MIDQTVNYILKVERKKAAGRRSYRPHSDKLGLRRYGRCWITHRPVEVAQGTKTINPYDPEVFGEQ